MKSIKLIILVLIMGTTFSCSDRETNLSYIIYGDTSKENPRYSTYMFFLHLDSAYSENQLKGIADSILAKNKQHGKPIEIVYSIPNRHLNPHVKSSYEDYAITKIENGTSQTSFNEDKKNEGDLSSKKNNLPTEEGQIGRWANQFGVYTMYKEKGEYYLENKFKDGSKSIETLRVKNKKGQTSYNVVGDNSEYMVIKDDGLYVYDNAGNLGLIYRNE